MEALGSGTKRSAAKNVNINKTKPVVSSEAASASSLNKIPKISSSEASNNTTNVDSIIKNPSLQNTNSLSRVIKMLIKLFESNNKYEKCELCLSFSSDLLKITMFILKKREKLKFFK